MNESYHISMSHDTHDHVMSCRNESSHVGMHSCHTATHCNTLQHTATHCNTLQHTATHCNTVQPRRNAVMSHRNVSIYDCSTLQHTATPCNTLQHTATPCNTLQHVATQCNTLQHAATRCNTLQHTVTHCNTLHFVSTDDSFMCDMTRFHLTCLIFMWHDPHMSCHTGMSQVT